NENLRLERLFREAIESHSLVEFPYQSDKDSRSRLRKVEPYLVAITDKGEIKVVGYSINDKESADQLKHYYFKKIKAGAVRVLPQKFHRLRVDPGKVYNTPTVKVVCRVKF
ncbi:MAG TPA: hypothetical protein VD996_11435, partial [Chitinophagaceae bacterium]|nr:hypothetical protein [Chitinophagaceae bacterium]